MMSFKKLMRFEFDCIISNLEKVIIIYKPLLEFLEDMLAKGFLGQTSSQNKELILLEYESRLKSLFMQVEKLILQVKYLREVTFNLYREKYLKNKSWFQG